MSLKMYHTIKDNVNVMPFVLPTKRKQVIFTPVVLVMNLKWYSLAFPYIVPISASPSVKRYQ